MTACQVEGVISVAVDYQVRECEDGECDMRHMQLIGKMFQHAISVS